MTPEMERCNQQVFCWSYVLMYLASPVLYVGVVQAALLSRLGTSAAVANMPMSGYAMAYMVPLFASSVIPYRFERATIVAADSITAVGFAGTGLALLLPCSTSVRIAVIIGQSLMTGAFNSIATVYRYQCLGRGTTEKGRARILKLTFTVGPIAAVLGGLLTQFILNQGISWISFPGDFGVLNIMAACCLLGTALLSRNYRIVELAEKTRPPFYRYIASGVKAFARNRVLFFLALGFFLWNSAFNAISTLSLKPRSLTSHMPQDLSGIIMASRFTGKSISGFAMGSIALHSGIRAPLIAVFLLVLGGITLAWKLSGYLFLIAFACMGAGELGGVYFPNYMISVSPKEQGARNLAILQLTTGLAGIAPAMFGAVMDRLGYTGSCLLGIGIGLTGLQCVLKLPAKTPERSEAENEVGSSAKS